jgi:hypothetical protein
MRLKGGHLIFVVILCIMSMNLTINSHALCEIPV